MAKRQSRRSLSINGSVYRRVHRYATDNGIPVAKLAEQALIALLDAAPAVAAPRIAVRPRPVYPGGTCACCVAVIPEGTVRPMTVPWGRNGAEVRVCSSCFPSDEDVAQPIANKRYRSASGPPPMLKMEILGAARRFDWFSPSELVDALDIPSGPHSDRARRNNFDVTISRLARRGHLERTGERMARRYRITDQGRAEYDHEIQRRAA